jgi:hypothetical protein
LEKFFGGELAAPFNCLLGHGMIANDSKKLILGLLSGLSLEQVKPFFLSLEKSGYRGDVCMVVSDLGVATQAFLRARRVQLVPFQKAFLKGFPAFAARLPAYVLSRRRRPMFDRQFAPACLHPRCSRYFFYQSYLQDCGGGYSHILLTDVGDVLFQADPFAFELPDGLGVFLEDRSRTIGACEQCSRAMLQAFGRTALREMRDRPIVTTGMTIGTTASIREHLASVTRILCQKMDRKPIDEAVHNFLIHQEPPAKLHCFENFSGPVLTMTGIDPARLQFNQRGQIINAAGQPIQTLLQYDRHPELAQKLVGSLT